MIRNRTLAALLTVVTAAGAFAGGLSTGAGMADAFHVDNGSTVRLVDDPAVSAGVCREYVGAVTVRSCAPITSPNGAAMVGQVEEDGSAAYADGLVYDAEDATFS